MSRDMRGDTMNTEWKNDDWRLTVRPAAAKAREELHRNREVPLTGAGKLSHRAIRRLALFLQVPVDRVAGNVPGALQDALGQLPWEFRLQRHRDRVVLQDVRFLFDEMDRDDLRRPRLKFMLEHAERRSRMGVSRAR